jgi:Mg-chelatase subunit ChlD
MAARNCMFRRLSRTIVACAVVALSLAGSTGGFAPRLRASASARVAILVDTSAGTSSALNLLRSALVGMIENCPADAELVLVSTGRRTQTRVPPTSDREKVKQSARSLTNDGGPTPLVDSLLEIDQRFMRSPGDRRPVFIIITGDGSESSRTDTDGFNAWLRTLASRHVVAHAIVLKTGNGVPEAVASTVARVTGGHFETVSAGGLETALKAVALRIPGE